MHIQEVNEVFTVFQIYLITDLEHFERVVLWKTLANSESYSLKIVLSKQYTVVEMEIADSHWALKNSFSVIFVELALWQGKLQWKAFGISRH